MRKIAAFRFDLQGSDEQDYVKLNGVVDQWINNKGTLGEAHGEFFKFDMKYGNPTPALYRKALYFSSLGELCIHTLKEEKESYYLQTSVELTNPKGAEVAIYIQIEIENITAGAPNRFIIKRPTLIKDILDAFPDKIHNIPSQGLDLKSEEGLKSYLGLFFSDERRYPMVVLSKTHESTQEDWSESLLRDLSYDLAGTAFVCRIDDEIAWKISETAGPQWSCFNGGIRVFWPSPKKVSNPFHHPLWTSERVQSRGKDVEGISKSVSSMFRKQLIMDLSPFSVVTPHVNIQIQKASSEEKFEAKIKEIRGNVLDANVYEEMIAEYEHQLNSYKDVIRDQENELAMLQFQLQELSRINVSKSSELSPVEEVKTVSEAVALAGKKYGKSIYFAERIDKSIETIADDAGPPSKILEYFEKLDNLSQEILAAGPGGIGSSQLKWLNENGVKCSGESDTTKANSKSRAKRTFSIGEEPIVFDKHMKLGDATDIKHCVRIYFEWDESRQMFLVGYVGEHID